MRAGPHFHEVRRCGCGSTIAILLQLAAVWQAYSEHSPKIPSASPMRNPVLLARWAALLALAILNVAGNALAREKAITSTELERVADAVDGVESSHGMDTSMWRVKPEGPQGPMQVSQKAATDVGGGDRFDIGQNRALGRAYLALLHRRYGNWPDAVSAYNWGMGNLDTWISGGRTSVKLVPSVAVYVRSVLQDSGICSSKAVGVQECQLPVPIGYKAFGLDVHRATTSGIKPYKLYLTGPDQSSVVLEVTSRPLPVLAVSGRPSRASIKPSILCHNLSEAGTAPRIATINPYSVFAADCRRR